MRKLFKSSTLQQKFEEDGFVQLSLLDQTQVEVLVQAYSAFREAHERIALPYITTSHSSDPQLITAVDDVLQAVIAPALEEHLINYSLLFGNYLVKMPVSNSATAPHQDITFVDEKAFYSVNIWIALQDIDKGNGSMYFLKGSHKFMPTVRPTHDYKWAYEHVKKEIVQRSDTIYAKAGDAFVFHHAIIHGSHANQSSAPRLAAVVAAYSADAPLIHYYLPHRQSGQLQKYGMNKEAYLYFEKEKPPIKGVYLGDEKFDFVQLDLQGFNRISGREQGIIQRIKDLLSIGNG